MSLEDCSRWYQRGRNLGDGNLPMQEEWEDTVSPLQDNAGGASSDKSIPMERMFYLYEENLL
ncbi:hypothetical protein [Sphingobacterium bambusae]|uniref:Uncharacterized protein n=1 Tax=Sphingobacterium bambusae TaxID=662858 RepID=A0ABW6B9T6_9SPHI|nr:hypothetical protein [Sphingobacterium bambusae]WPL48572.1 hypothetical protein SCB77_21725 [Sphingobacterium bambusae]